MAETYTDNGVIVVGDRNTLLVMAFMHEPRNRNMEAPYTHWGMYVILAGVIFHGLSGLKQKKNKVPN
jgi:hypothetical protein